MTSFIRPQGINFRCHDELPAAELAHTLCRIASYLQTVEPNVKLQRYDDWWEHDGLHFVRGLLDFDTLFTRINSPRSVLESVPCDDCVFVGIAALDGSWYLRFRVECDEEGFNLLGRFDITLPDSLAETIPKRCDPVTPV